MLAKRTSTTRDLPTRETLMRKTPEWKMSTKMTPTKVQTKEFVTSPRAGDSCTEKTPTTHKDATATTSMKTIRPQDYNDIRVSILQLCGFRSASGTNPPTTTGQTADNNNDNNNNFYNNNFFMEPDKHAPGKGVKPSEPSRGECATRV